MKQQTGIASVQKTQKESTRPPVLVLGAGLSAAYVAQSLAVQHEVVQIKWGPVADLPLDWLMESENSLKGRSGSSWVKIAAAELLAWTGSVGEYVLRLELENGEVKDLVGKAVVVALDALPATDVALGERALVEAEQRAGRLITLGALAQELSLASGPVLDRLKGPGVAVDPQAALVAIFLDPGGLEAAPNTRLALRSALTLKQQGTCRVGIFYAELAIGALDNEVLYQKCRRAGVEFFRYTELPQLKEVGGQLSLSYRDPLLPPAFSAWEIPIRLCVTANSYLPSKALVKAGTLAGLPFGPDGFLLSDTLHAWSGQTTRKGIYRLGMAGGPLRLLALAEEAAGVALALSPGLGQNLASLVAQVDPLRCEVCLTCVRVCPHHAVEIRACSKRTAAGKLYTQAAWIHPEACQGCGICLAECPALAIDWATPWSMENETNPRSRLKPEEGRFFYLLDNDEVCTVSSFGELSPVPGSLKMVVLACQQSGFLAAETLAHHLPVYTPALKSRIVAEIGVYPLPCAGQVDTSMVFKALTAGAHKVVIAACHFGACQHERGNLRAKNRFRLTEQYLQEIGLKDRLTFYSLAAQEHAPWLAWLKKQLNR